jgi:Ca-activated chloride channel family protein
MKHCLIILLATWACLVQIVPAQTSEEASVPGVTITSPEAGAYTSGRTLLEAQVTAAGDDPVVQVDFLVNGTLVASLENPPFQVLHDFGDTVEARFIQVMAVTAGGQRLRAEVTTRGLVVHQSAGIDLVNVFATVQDGRGRYVMNLKREDFFLLEDGRPQKVTYFSQDRLPLAVVIVIDTSLSMEGRNLEEARDAATGFLKALEPGDLVSILGFSDKVRLLEDLGEDHDVAAEAISRTGAGGGTALYDAVADASRLLAGVKDERRRSIILLSDGRDEAADGMSPGSLLTFEEALAEVVQANVILYAIGLGRDLDEEMDFYHRRSLAEVLETMAAESGGRAFFTAKAERLRKAYNEVEEELRHHYMLSYTSTNRRQDGMWRRIDLKVRRSGHSAHARRGYYAPWSGPPG